MAGNFVIFTSDLDGSGGLSWNSCGMKKDISTIFSQAGPAPGTIFLMTGTVISIFCSKKEEGIKRLLSLLQQAFSCIE